MAGDGDPLSDARSVESLVAKAIAEVRGAAELAERVNTSLVRIEDRLDNIEAKPGDVMAIVSDVEKLHTVLGIILANQETAIASWETIVQHVAKEKANADLDDAVNERLGAGGLPLYKSKAFYTALIAALTALAGYLGSLTGG
jgi:hypothetical protein